LSTFSPQCLPQPLCGLTRDTTEALGLAAFSFFPTPRGLDPTPLPIFLNQRVVSFITSRSFQFQAARNFFTCCLLFPPPPSPTTLFFPFWRVFCLLIFFFSVERFKNRVSPPMAIFLAGSCPPLTEYQNSSLVPPILFPWLQYLLSSRLDVLLPRRPGFPCPTFFVALCFFNTWFSYHPPLAGCFFFFPNPPPPQHFVTCSILRILVNNVFHPHRFAFFRSLLNLIPCAVTFSFTHPPLNSVR